MPNLAMTTQIIAQRRAEQYAPLVRFHPDEYYRAINPETFIQHARFRNHRSWGRDYGWNKRLEEWRKTDSHDSDYYDIPVEKINSYRLTADGKNRIPGNNNASNSWQVFLDVLKAPGNKINKHLNGPSDPDGRISCYFVVGRVKSEFRIVYWWFHAFNDSKGFNAFNHEGDWERITVAFDAKLAFKGIYYHRHKDATFLTRKQIRWQGTHPIVYTAKGTHASYEKPGSFRATVDRTADGGVGWKTWHRLSSLEKQPWRDFAGAWGEVGTGSGTTGVAGPYMRGLKVKGD